MEPISRVPIVQQVEERIRELIQEEQYQPGKKLPPEMELCQRLGVGRGTVREAFRLLQAKGVVEIKPGRGAFVAENPAERDIGAIDWLVENERELRDSIEIRTALEPMAARRMAERCNTEDIRRLENIHRSFLSAIQEGDAAMIGRLDEQFHSAIVESSGNALMIEINSHVCQGMQTFRSKTFQVEQNVKNAVMPHSNIMNAILARDAAQAEREMRAHLDKVQEDLTQDIHAPGLSQFHVFSLRQHPVQKLSGGRCGWGISSVSRQRRGHGPAQAAVFWTCQEDGRGPGENRLCTIC